jgi:hypothetical protein
MRAIAQNRHAIDDLRHFVEPVRDVQDRDTGRAQLLNDAKELRRFRFGQGRRGLVHDQHTRIERQRFRDFDHLLLRDRKRPDLRRRSDVQADALKAAHGIGVELARIDERPALRFACEVEILGDAQMGNEVQFLVNDRDTRGLCFGRGRESHRFVAIVDGAFIGQVLAADDFHQRRFAGTVLAADCMNLARAQIETNAVECDDAGKALHDALEAQDLPARVVGIGDGEAG